MLNTYIKTYTYTHRVVYYKSSNMLSKYWQIIAIYIYMYIKLIICIHT